MGGGPNITKQTVLDYLNDRLDYDPVTQQYMDQANAAADDVRAAFGIVHDGSLEIPSPRAWKAISAMWSRLVTESEHDVCEHIEQRPLQPIAIIPEERRQLCLDCAHRWVVPELVGTRHACPGCGDVETLTPGLYAELLQWGHYVSLLLLCFDCRQLMIYDRVDLPPEIRNGVAEALRKSKA